MDRTLNILHLEDRPADAELALRELRREGLNVTVRRVETADALAAALRDQEFDIILADYALPGYDGISALKLAREQRPEVPFIFVSGTMGEERAIEAMQHGATDYVLKQRLGRLGPAVRRALHEVVELEKRQRAEQALQENQELLRQVIDLVPHHIFAKDREGRFIFANSASAASSGNQPGDLVGKLGSEIRPQTDQAAKFHSDDLEVIKSGKPKFIAEEAITYPDGQVHFLQTTKIPFTPPGTNERAVLGVAVDITELRKAEEDVRASEARLRAFCTALPDVALLLDEDGRYVEVLTSADHLLYKGSETLMGKTLPEVFPADQAAVFMDVIRRTLETGAVQIIEYAMQLEGGQTWFDGHVAPVTAFKSAKRMVVFLARDITERKRAEAAIRESEKHFRSLFENMLSGYAHCRLIYENGEAVDYEYLAANEAFERVSGLKDVVGKRVSEVVPGYCRDNPDSMAYFSGVAKSGKPTRWEHYLAALNRWFSFSTYCPAPGEFVVICENITERKRAEDTLRASEERYRLLAENTEDFVVLNDTKGNNLFISPSFYRVTGWTPAENKPDDWKARMHPDDLAVIRKARDANLTCEPTTIEHRVRCRDGSWLWVEARCKPICDSNGHVENLLVMSRDITRRKQVEGELRGSEAEFRAMFETASIGIAQADLKTGQWVRVNQKMCAITGYTTDELLQKRVSEITHPDDRQRDWDAFQRVVRGETPDYRIEKRYVRKNGTEAWVNVNMTVIRDAAGQPVRTMATIEDITERRRAMESQARLVTAVEQSPETIVITDTNGMIVYANPAFERITGYTRAEALGQNPRVLKSGKHGEEFYREMWATLSAGQVWSGHLVNKRKDGTLYEEDATISPVFDAAGKIINYVAVKRDVTAELRLESQFRQAQKMEVIGHLAAGVAHDFNNMLQAILGFTEILLGETAPETTQHADLLEIKKTSGRAADLTRQLLALGRKQNLDQRVTDVNKLIEEFNKMLHRVIGEDIKIEFDLAPDLDRVMADHGQLGQVLLNLAVNARDAMPRGGRLVFSTSCRTFSANDLAVHPGVGAGRFICTAVSDTGTGMSREILERLFEPFFTTKEPGKGTGLGLATSYGIVRQHGGWLDAYSELGQGSTFRLYLPVVERTPAPLEIEPAAKPASAESLGGSGRHILFVEDEALIRSMIKRHLERNGYRVTLAASAGEAKRQFTLAAGNYDLVLTDVVLPDQNGIEMLQEFVARKPDLRVLISSGYTDNDKRWPVILERKWPFIGKPYSMSELLEALRRVFAGAP